MKQKEKTKKFVEGITTIIVIVLVIIIGLYIQSNILDNFNSYCNEKYGEKNWTTISADRTNMTLRDKYYIGEIWTCVPISNSENLRHIKVGRG